MTPEAYATLLKQIGSVEHEIDLQRIRCNHSVADAGVYTRETKLFWQRLHELGDLARDLARKLAGVELAGDVRAAMDAWTAPAVGWKPRHRTPPLGSTPPEVETLSTGEDGD